MEKIKMRDMLAFKFLSGLRKNEAEKKIAFLVHRMNEESNDYDSNIWIMDCETHEKFQLTTDNKVKQFFWEDDNTILFISTRNDDEEKDYPGSTRVFRIAINGGEALEAFQVPIRAGEIKVIEPFKKYAIAGYYEIGQSFPLHPDEEAVKTRKKKKEEEKDYEVLDEIPYWQNGMGYINGKRNGLFILDTEKDTFEKITGIYTDLETMDLNRKTRKIAFNAITIKNKMELRNRVYLYDYDNNNLADLTGKRDMLFRDVIFLNDEELFSIGTDKKAYGLNENAKFYRINITEKTVDCITPELDLPIGNSVGTDCRYGPSSGHVLKAYNGEVYFPVTKKAHSHLYKITPEGKLDNIIDLSGTMDDFCISCDRIYEIAFREQRLQELYLYKDEEEKRLSDFNEWVQNDRVISPPEPFDIERMDKPDIQGWFITPPDFDQNRQYPAILDIHGGPKTAYGEIFFHEMQTWAANGYVVFFCNPRGSDGKGNAFADIRGKYGEIDYDDIMEFSEAVVDKFDFIDEERIGVTGGSYGGYMTNWIIGQTDRFKAAASQRSISNWISKFCTTDIGYYFVQDQSAGATPWDNHEQLWKSSPLKYADRAKTPTLFIHSEEDYRCWYPEGLQMFTALKFHGVDARLCLFKGENHELSRGGKPLHRIRRLQEITDWFDKYLKDE